jgi:hypothetical protein
MACVASARLGLESLNHESKLWYTSNRLMTWEWKVPLANYFSRSEINGLWHLIIIAQ